MSELHTRGFVVLPHVCPDLPRERYKRARYKQAWVSELSKAHVTGGGHRFRYQIADQDCARSLCADMDKCMAAHGLNLCARHTRKPYVLNTCDEHNPDNAVQLRHTDYEAGMIASLVHDPDRVPLSCLWAVCREFELVVWPLDDPSVPRTVHVPAGHMIVFRGDLWHGGGRHLNSAFRVHGYVAEPSTYIPDFLYG